MNDDIAHVRGALSEGFCPEGHPLSDGGGIWGSCDTCRTTWTVTVPGYSHRSYGPTDDFWMATEQGKFRVLQKEA